jgi:hypothetical protein
MQSEIDLLYADLVDGDLVGAELVLPALWDRLGDATGWERWLAPGRLSVAGADIALRQESWEAAIEGALEAIEIAQGIGREKYEVSARIILGTAQLELGRPKDAVAGLGAAVEGADRLGHPPTRWQGQAALGSALIAIGDDEGAIVASREATGTIRNFAATLKTENAERLLASAPVQEILRAG